jgi:hypothetical protein
MIKVNLLSLLSAAPEKGFTGPSLGNINTDYM